MELTDQLKEQYPLLTSLRFAGMPHSNREPLPYFLGLLLAVAESPDRRGCCFVFPDASRIAYTSAILLAFSKLTREFDDLVREYAQRELEPGQRVRIWPTGHVYEYEGVLEAEGRWSKRFELLGKDGLRTLPISDVLRLEPTTRKSPKGYLTTPLNRGLKPGTLDTLVGIQSWGNRSMLRNRILYLTSKSGFEKFLSSTICSGVGEDDEVRLADALPWGTIDEDGNFFSSNTYQVEGEPLLAVSHAVENIAEASLRAEPFSTVVFADDPHNLVRNLQACDEITDSQKLIVVASHKDDETLATLEDRDFVMWQVSPEEMDLGHDAFGNVKSVFFSRTLNAARNYRKLKLDTLVCREETVESVASDLQRASDHLKLPDSDEETKRCLKEMFNILFSISDRCMPLETQEKIEFHERLAELRQTIERRSIWVPEEVTEHLLNACATLSKLISALKSGSQIGEQKGKVLLEFLQENAAYQDRQNIILTRYSRNVVPVRKWLLEKGMDVPVMWYKSLPDNQTFDTIIVLSWLNSDRFGKLVKRYAAPHVRLLSYPFEKKWISQFSSRFSRERSGKQTDSAEKSAVSGLPAELLPSSKTRVQAVPQATEQNIETSSIFEIERRIMRRRKGAKPGMYYGHDSCQSRYVGFAGEWYAYLTETREVPVVTSLVRDGGYSAPTTIPVRTISELAIGDFLLFREGSDRDVVQLFAEESIGSGEYAKQRTLTKIWRDALLSRGGSVSEIYRLLKSHGLKKTVFTVRSWLHNRNLIGPGEKKDIEIIASATREHFTANPEEVWKAIESIRTAHRRAGHTISRWLLEELAGKRDLVTDGGAKIDLGFGRFWIVEIEEIGADQDEYPLGKVNHLLQES